MAEVPTASCLVQALGGGFGEVQPLAVHLVAGERTVLGLSEGPIAYVERDGFRPHSLVLELFQDRLGEMEPGGGSRYRTFLFGVDGLIAPRSLVRLDIRRQRDLTERLQLVVDLFLKLHQRRVALARLQGCCSYPTDRPGLARLPFTQHFPASRSELAQQEKLFCVTALILSPKTSPDYLGVVQYNDHVRIQELR